MTERTLLSLESTDGVAGCTATLVSENEVWISIHEIGEDSSASTDPAGLVNDIQALAFGIDFGELGELTSEVFTVVELATVARLLQEVAAAEIVPTTWIAATDAAGEAAVLLPDLLAT